MASKKRLHYGVDYFRGPIIPKAPRSIRRRAPDRNSIEDGKFCAFELLAVVAGKLLQQGEISASSNVAVGKNKQGVSCWKVENEQKMRLEDEKCQMGELSMPRASNVNEPNEECVNSSILVNLDSSVQLPLHSEPVADAFLQKHCAGVNLGIRDDDENSYGCKKISTMAKPFKPQPRIQHCRIRKMVTSKYRTVAPKLRGYELYNASMGMKLFSKYRKRIYIQERFQHVPIKKRKLSNHRFSDVYDQDASSNSISDLPKESRTTSGTAKPHKKANDPHVKFSIKALKVPELFIEVPETETVGSLKRTVMEAVTAIIGCGIRVGVVLQGKKVPDDSTTLLQAGISQTTDFDNLSFTLEPCFTQVSLSKTAKKHSSVLPCVENQELPGSPVTPMIDSDTSNPPQLTIFDDGDVDEGPLSSPHTPANELMDGLSVPDSKNALNVGPLPAVSMSSKLKSSELSQRRTRRPFSVAEVEALVGSVEKLGTGRWRDIKVGAFENADHRTCVDLKDKWKTLVHTAQICPHQRRGEPVPQELLDRVLSAHSYWAQHQSKQHGKNTVETLKTAD